MEIRTVVEHRDSVQYNGTNGAEIVEMFEGTSAEDDGATLSFRHPAGSLYRVQAGDHILFIDNRGINDGYCDWHGSYPDESFSRKFRGETERDNRLAALESEVAALRSRIPASGRS